MNPFDFLQFLLQNCYFSLQPFWYSTQMADMILVVGLYITGGKISQECFVGWKQCWGFRWRAWEKERHRRMEESRDKSWGWWTVMSAGRVGSRFWDVSNSTGRWYRRVVTRPISDRSGYSVLVSRLIFTSVGSQHRPDLTGLGSSLNIINLTRPIWHLTRHCNV